MLIKCTLYLSISDLLDVKLSLTGPMSEEEVMNWSWTALGRLRVLRVFKELPGSIGSRSSGLIKA